MCLFRLSRAVPCKVRFRGQIILSFAVHVQPTCRRVVCEYSALLSHLWWRFNPEDGLFFRYLMWGYGDVCEGYNSKEDGGFGEDVGVEVGVGK
jgi:hypothetical protein